MPLLQSGIPVSEQSISIDGRDLNDRNATIASLGVSEGAMLLLRRKVTVGGRYARPCRDLITATDDGSRTVEQDAEMIRLRILGDPNLMRELREVSIPSSRVVTLRLTLRVLHPRADST